MIYLWCERSFVIALGHSGRVPGEERAPPVTADEWKRKDYSRQELNGKRQLQVGTGDSAAALAREESGLFFFSAGLFLTLCTSLEISTHPI